MPKCLGTAVLIHSPHDGQIDFVKVNSYLVTALIKFFPPLWWQVKIQTTELVPQSCLTLCDPMDSSPAGSSVHGDSPGKNTGVGCHALLQGIFPTQGLNPGVPTLQVDFFYHLSHQGSPRILEGVAYPFSRESFRPRNRTRVSCIAGGFFTSWTTREALAWHKRHLLV